MENAYFKMIGQKSPNNKLILVAVVDEDFMGEEVPDIFEVQCLKPAINIYTGTYPTIKVNVATIKDRSEDCKGAGIGGILINEQWYYQREKDKDIFGINL